MTGKLSNRVHSICRTDQRGLGGTSTNLVMALAASICQRRFFWSSQPSALRLGPASADCCTPILTAGSDSYRSSDIAHQVIPLARLFTSSRNGAAAGAVLIAFGLLACPASFSRQLPRSSRHCVRRIPLIEEFAFCSPVPSHWSNFLVGWDHGEARNS
jgi:hypothetical protein